MIKTQHQLEVGQLIYGPYFVDGEKNFHKWNRTNINMHIVSTGEDL